VPLLTEALEVSKGGKKEYLPYEKRLFSLLLKSWVWGRFEESVF
jgi:hypothetical protein